MSLADTNVNWDGVADSDVVAKGIYQARFASWKEGETKNGKLNVSVRWVIEEPVEYVNVSLFEMFVLGSDDQPEAIVPTAFGTREMKKTFKALAVQTDPSMVVTLDRALETSCLLAIENETYEGRLQNRIKGHYALGDRVPSVASASPAAPSKPASPLAGRPSTRRVSAA